MQKSIFMLSELFNEVIPISVRPTLVNVIISTANIEFCVKMLSLGLSSAYLIYKWSTEIKKNKK